MSNHRLVIKSHSFAWAIVPAAMNTPLRMTATKLLGQGSEGMIIEGESGSSDFVHAEADCILLRFCSCRVDVQLHSVSPPRREAASTPSPPQLQAVSCSYTYSLARQFLQLHLQSRTPVLAVHTRFLDWWRETRRGCGEIIGWL
jgi:hypothetical protein